MFSNEIGKTVLAIRSVNRQMMPSMKCNPMHPCNASSYFQHAFHYCVIISSSLNCRILAKAQLYWDNSWDTMLNLSDLLY
jgi:hypothetical protein